MNAYTQIDLFDLVREQKPLPEPLLQKGERIYVVSYDTPRLATVHHCYLCKERSDNPYYGYHISFEDGGGDCVWDYMVGHSVFLDEAKAAEVASKSQIPRVDISSLVLTDGIGYCYNRELDNYQLSAYIAKVGERQLLEKEFMCYCFLRTYKSAKERDVAYKKLSASIVSEAEKSNGIPHKPPNEPLYYVNNALFASRGYAKSHTTWRDAVAV